MWPREMRVFLVPKAMGNWVGHNLFCEKRIAAGQEWKRETRQETGVVI